MLSDLGDSKDHFRPIIEDFQRVPPIVFGHGDQDHAFFIQVEQKALQFQMTQALAFGIKINALPSHFSDDATP